MSEQGAAAPPTPEQAREMLGRIRVDGLNAEGRENVGRALKAALGEAGRAIWLEWMSAANFDQEPAAKLDHRWPDLEVGGLSELSLAYMADLGVFLGEEMAAYERRTLIAKFNRLYAVVDGARKTWVYMPKFDAGLNRTIHDYKSFEDFSRLFWGHRIEVRRTDEGKKITKTLGEFWLNHPGKREYLGGVVFKPPGQPVPPNALNLWRGFAVKPRPGSWALLREHARLIVCNGDPVSFKYLMGWMATAVRYPGRRGEVAVVMRGGKGSGKGTLAQALLRIFGQHGIQVSDPAHLTGTFNGHLRDKVLLFADEAFYAGDKKHESTLKRLITERTLSIEAKFQNMEEAQNLLHLIMASNENWVVPVSLRDRRFFVLNVSPDRMGDDNRAHFDAIYAEMDNGGVEAMLHDLLEYDLTGFKIRNVPVTDGLQDQQNETLATKYAWLHECGNRGYVFESRRGLSNVFGTWMEEISHALLYASYRAHAARENDRRPMKVTAFGRFLTEMGFEKARLWHGIIGEEERATTDGYRRAEPVKHDKCADGRRLGTLAEFRARWEAATGLPGEWGEDGPAVPESGAEQAGVPDRAGEEEGGAALQTGVPPREDEPEGGRE